MHLKHLSVAFIFGLLAGCASQSAPKPVEVLDERTGATLGLLQQPIDLVASAQNAGFSPGKHVSFAYLGPVEWNRSGTIGYGLWIHVAPGNDRQVSNIHAPGAVSLILDDGPLTLSLIDAPKLGREAYQPVVSWGQTAYFDLTVEMLKRMAASQKLELDVRAADDSTVSFSPGRDTRAILAQYARGRGITDD